MNIKASKILDDPKTGKPFLWEIDFSSANESLDTYLLELQEMIFADPERYNIVLEDDGLPIFCPIIPRFQVSFDANDVDNEFLEILKKYHVRRLARVSDWALIAHAGFFTPPAESEFETVNKILLEKSKEISANVVDAIFNKIYDQLDIHPRIREALSPIFWVLYMPEPE